MQATIHRFHMDPRTGSVRGSVLTDQGLVLPLLSTALYGSGLRHLRVGQRVRIELAAEELAPGIHPVERVSLGSIGAEPGPISRP